MAAIVNIPFNFQPPVSPTRVTSAYTVPAGRYARVRAFFYQARSFNSGTNGFPTITPGWITVNGVNVLPERSFHVDCFTSGNGTSAGFNVTGFSGMFQGYYSTSNTNTTTISTGLVGINMSGAPATIPSIQFGISGQFYVQVTNSTHTAELHGTITQFSAPEYIDLWLKAGDVLNATAGNWEGLVNEYIIPS